MVEITPIKKETIGYVAQEKLWLTKDGKIVKDGDHRAFQLLAAPGDVIRDKVAARLGLDKGAKLEPFEAASTKAETAGGFKVAPSGFNAPKTEARQTIAPEDISARSTRPEQPPVKR